MTNLKTAFPLFQVADPRKAAAFYSDHFDFEKIFDSDWYVQIRHGSQELAFILVGHESIPKARQALSQNTCLTLEVDPETVPLLFNTVKASMEIMTPLKDEPWGQRHFLGYDPAGIMLDVMAMLPQAD